MYYKNIDLREKEQIEIVCLSDWHLGSKNFEDKKAKQFIANGGSVDTIKTKYELSKEAEIALTKK